VCAKPLHQMRHQLVRHGSSAVIYACNWSSSSYLTGVIQEPSADRVSYCVFSVNLSIVFVPACTGNSAPAAVTCVVCLVAMLLVWRSCTMPQINGAHCGGCRLQCNLCNPQASSAAMRFWPDGPLVVRCHLSAVKYASCSAVSAAAAAAALLPGMCCVFRRGETRLHSPQRSFYFIRQHHCTIGTCMPRHYACSLSAESLNAMCAYHLCVLVYCMAV
jgi:hypothetical protein